MKKAEIIIGIASLLAIVMNLLFIPGATILTVLSLSILSCMYMYFGFALFNGIRLRNITKKESYVGISMIRIIGAIGAGLALSITIIGILFRLQAWPGAVFQLFFGLLTLGIVLIIGTIKYFKSKSVYYIMIFKRITIIGGIALLLVIIPRIIWIDMRYKNHPAYRDALKKAIADPNNQDLWKKADAEREKMEQGE